MEEGPQLGIRSAPTLAKMLLPRWLDLAVFLLVTLSLIGVITYLPDNQFGILLDIVICLVLIAGVVFVFPSRRTLISVVPVIFVALFALRVANAAKSGVTAFPLTSTDLSIVLSSPTDFLLALGAPVWAEKTLIWLAYPTIALAAWWAFIAVKRTGIRRSAIIAIRTGIRAICAAAVLAVLGQSVIKSVSSYQTAHSEIPVWHGDGLILFSERVGILGFLTYSYFFESGERDHFLTYASKDQPPSQQEVEASTRKYILAERLDGVLPNIILIHAESTFDPNEVLNLAAPVTNGLFYSHPGDHVDEGVQYLGPGIANVVGGGSWVTEFEVISGIDSRLFGTAGRYTHDALSPFSRHAFPRYLRERGYEVSAFTSVSPAFYNSKKAYKLYGFENFYSRMGLEDQTIMSNVLAIEPTKPDAPFLKFVLLTENHAPHRCEASHAIEYEQIEFAGKASVEQLCALREYLWRAKSTEKAVTMARDFLVKEQARTGRPYVIAIYGDHQPYTFTGGGGHWSLGLDFTEHRKDTSKRKVILEFISSKENPLICCSRDPIPLTLMPTMISAYVATSPTTLYLPENFYQIDHCGSDWIGYLVGRLFYQEAEVGGSRSNCDKYEALIAAYQQSGVFGLERIRDTSATTDSMPALLLNRFLSWWSTSGLLVVDAAGTSFKGSAPKVEVLIGDDVIGQLALDNAPDNSNQKVETPEIYLSSEMSTFSTPSCSRRIKFRFVNDDYAGKDKTGDRNVYVKSAVLNGVTIPLAAARIEPPDAGQVFDDGVLWMWRNGSATIDNPGDSGCGSGVSSSLTGLFDAGSKP